MTENRENYSYSCPVKSSEGIEVKNYKISKNEGCWLRWLGAEDDFQNSVVPGRWRYIYLNIMVDEGSWKKIDKLHTMNSFLQQYPYTIRSLPCEDTIEYLNLLNKTMV